MAEPKPHEIPPSRNEGLIMTSEALNALSQASGISFPDEDYIIRLGCAVYAVSRFTGSILTDLRGIPDLPAELDPDKMIKEGLTTNAMGKLIRNHAAEIADAGQRSWAEACGQFLLDAEIKRQRFLKSGAITDDAQRQRLAYTTGGEQVLIDDAALDDYLRGIGDAIRNLPPAP